MFFVVLGWFGFCLLGFFSGGVGQGRHITTSLVITSPDVLSSLRLLLLYFKSHILYITGLSLTGQFKKQRSNCQMPEAVVSFLSEYDSLHGSISQYFLSYSKCVLPLEDCCHYLLWFGQMISYIFWTWSFLCQKILSWKVHVCRSKKKHWLLNSLNIFWGFSGHEHSSVIE